MVRRRSIQTLLVLGAAIGAMGMSIGDSFAGGFALREQSAVGQGSSFAGAGTPGMGLSAMFWNPAAITQTKGWMSESHLAAVLPNTDTTALPGTSLPLTLLGTDAGNVGRNGLIPVSYGAYQFTPNFFVGYSMNTPFGLSTGTNVPWAGQQLGTRGEVKSVDFAAIVGWKVNDWISVGAGPRVIWLQGKFDRSLAPLALPVTSSLKVDDFGFGFAAGLTLTPWGPGTEIALGYRSQVDLELDGTAQLPLFAPLGPLSGGKFNIGNGKVKTPDQVTLSVRHRVSELFTLLGTVEWANWSNVQAVPFTFTSGPAAGTLATTLTFNYRDGWLFALGGEYEVTPQHTLRAGIAYEISPVRDAVRDIILPDNDRWWFSVGLSSKVFNWATLDFGYSFVWIGNTPINVVPGHPDVALIAPFSLVASTEPYIHILAASLRIKWYAAPPSITGKG